MKVMTNRLRRIDLLIAKSDFERATQRRRRLKLSRTFIVLRPRALAEEHLCVAQVDSAFAERSVAAGADRRRSPPRPPPSSRPHFEEGFREFCSLGGVAFLLPAFPIITKTAES
jgi:hypothetical protein